jgi:hypothetical protein
MLSRLLDNRNASIAVVISGDRTMENTKGLDLSFVINAHDFVAVFCLSPVSVMHDSFSFSLVESNSGFLLLRRLTAKDSHFT